jgi:hypothetical protein
MKLGRGKNLFLATLCVVVLSAAGWAQLPCGVPGQIYCQPWDGGGNLSSSQNDTNGFGNFATVYDNFTLKTSADITSFHWVGGYFNPPAQGPITAWTLTFYNDAAGIPDLVNPPIFTLNSPGTAGETFINANSGFPTYVYWLYFKSVDVGPGTYWASVVPDLGFPPQWGWASGTGGDGASYQCFFGTCGALGSDMAFALDQTPEPGTFVLLGTGILGLAGTIRRKLL